MQQLCVNVTRDMAAGNPQVGAMRVQRAHTTQGRVTCAVRVQMQKLAQQEQLCVPHVLQILFMTLLLPME